MKCPICKEDMYCRYDDFKIESYKCFECHLLIEDDKKIVSNIEYTVKQFERYLKLKMFW